MDYKEFEKLVITGHNVEFEYDNKKYSVLKGPDKYTFSELDNENNLVEYTNILQLLVSTKVNEKYLKDISGDMQNIQVN